MNEHPLLAVFAQFTGSFLAANNPSTEELQAFHTNIATALLQQQPIGDLQHTFQFENMQNLSIQHLNDEDLQYLNTVLINAEKEIQTSNTFRIFRREVPFASSQVKGSVPDWARGAKAEQTLGPFINLHGQQNWFDLYKIFPGVQLFLQGAAQPALILTLKIFRVLAVFQKHTDYPIPASSIWINSHLISPSAPDNQFCGLTIAGGTLHFTNDVLLNANNTMVVLPGTVATITLQLTEQVDVSVSPDNTGIDAKNAVVNLPLTLSFSFSDTGSQILSAGDASLKVYQQQDSLTFNNNTPGFYLPQFNRVCIPYQSSATSFDTANCLSIVCNIKGTASILRSAWSLSCAALDVNNPLEAKGIGAMMIQTDKGLSASWYGLQDMNLKNKEWVNLCSAWILSEPGRISITDLNAGNINAKQEYKLWKNDKDQWNTIDLQYTDSFLFFYNCLQSGNEAVMALINCTGAIDRPVDVAGKPFAFNSKQTIYLLNGRRHPSLLYYMMITFLLITAVISPGKLLPFNLRLIALNNALLTVSPLKGFLFAGRIEK